MQSAIADHQSPVRNLADGHQVDQVLLVQSAEARKTRKGSDFMRLSLADRTGVVTGMVWDGVETATELAQPGSAIRVTGQFSRHPRFGAQIAVRSLAVPEAVDWDQLVEGPSSPVEELEAELDGLIDTLRDHDLAELMALVLDPASETGGAYRRAFAAKYNHHAYRHGLLEHSLAVAKAVDAASQIFGSINRDLAVCGALLHDIGKLRAYVGDEHAVEVTDLSRMIGEIPMGYYLVRRQIEDLPDFPPDLARALLHIILSHHGCLEYGSPVVPATREALLVHTMDNLSGDLGSFDRLDRETASDESWSRYDRALGRSVFLSQEPANN